MLNEETVIQYGMVRPCKRCNHYITSCFRVKYSVLFPAKMHYLKVLNHLH